jgi:hypothetical protein
LFLLFLPLFETFSSNEESLSSLEEEYVLPFLPFVLSFLFSALSFSSFFMRSFKVGVFEVLDLEPSSMTSGLPSSSNFGGRNSISSPTLDIVSPSG